MQTSTVVSVAGLVAAQGPSRGPEETWMMCCVLNVERKVTTLIIVTTKTVLETVVGWSGKDDTAVTMINMCSRTMIFLAISST